jgi:phosphatidylglycerol:prolipoprotein diacylglycerol transferase
MKTFFRLFAMMSYAVGASSLAADKTLIDYEGTPQRRRTLLFGRGDSILAAVHDIAFKLGPLTITWYGIFVASGFLFGLWNASRRALRANLNPEMIFDCGTWLLVGTVVGARALYVVSYWSFVVDAAQEYHHSPVLEIFMVQHGGIVYYGGLIGASAACILFAWRKRVPLWKLADILAPGVALGSFFGRWGCLMHGCCYGRPTDLPWGIQFPVGHETHPHDDGLPHYVHPTQIYDSLLNLVLFAGLAWFYRRRKFDGQVFALYLVCYAVLRSFVEYFRGDYPKADLVAGWITPAQCVSAGTLLAGVLLLWLLPKREKKKMENGG